jgi:hypothetical protein
VVPPSRRNHLLQRRSHFSLSDGSAIPVSERFTSQSRRAHSPAPAKKRPAAAAAAADATADADAVGPTQPPLGAAADRRLTSGTTTVPVDAVSEITTSVIHELLATGLITSPLLPEPQPARASAGLDPAAATGGVAGSAESAGRGSSKTARVGGGVGASDRTRKVLVEELDTVAGDRAQIAAEIASLERNLAAAAAAAAATAAAAADAEATSSLPAPQASSPARAPTATARGEPGVSIVCAVHFD